MAKVDITEDIKHHSKNTIIYLSKKMGNNTKTKKQS